MAKGNLILGTMSGKLGDVVAYTNNGKQCARVRRRVVANPNSAGQRVQRMILTTVAQAVSNLRPVLNNAFEGVQKGAPSLAFARSLYMKMLRTENMYNADNGMNYVKKGGQYFAPNRYMVSRGSLGAVDSNWRNDDNALAGAMFGTELSATITATQLFPQAAIGMQHTFIFVDVYEDTSGQIRSRVPMCRFVFKDDSTPALVADGANFKLNPAALDLDYSAGYNKLLFMVDGSTVMVTWRGSDNEPVGGAYILSTKDGSRRATSLMVLNQSVIQDNGVWSPDVVVESYENGGVDTGAPAEYLLDDNPGGN